MNTVLLLVLAAAALVPAGIGSADAQYFSSAAMEGRSQVFDDCVESKNLQSFDYIIQLSNCADEIHAYDVQLGFY